MKGELKSFRIAVRLLTVQQGILGIKRVAEISYLSERRGGFTPAKTAVVFTQHTGPKRAGVKILKVILLRQQLREVSAAGWCKQIGDKLFAFTRRFQAKVVALRVFLSRETVCQKKVPGKIRI